MAIATQLPMARAVFFDAAGNPLAGGLVSTFIPATTTPKLSWQDAAETTPNSNPIVLDTVGSCLLYGEGAYQLTVTDALGVAVPGYSGVTQSSLSTAGGTITGDLTVEGLTTLQGGAVLPNNVPLQGEDTGGTPRALIYYNNADQLIFGGGSAGTAWLDSTGLVGTMALDNSGNLQTLGTLSTHGEVLTTPGVFTNVAMHDAASFMVNGASSQAEFQWSHVGNFSTEALAAGIVVPAGSTVYQVNAIAGYVQNGSTAAAGSVAGVFYARNTVAGAKVFGINPLVTDQTNVGTGGNASTVVGAEFDIGAFNPATLALGINMVGVFPSGTPTTSIAYQVSQLNSPWGTGYNSPDGSTVTAINIGALAATANNDGQAINLSARDNTATSRIVGIQAQHTAAGANLLLNCPTGGVVIPQALSVTGLTALAGAAVVTAAATDLVGFQAVTTPVGSITTNGTTTAYNTTSDYRIKTITGADPDGSLIDRIPTHTGHFNNHPDQSQTLVLAHEAQEFMPWAVTGVKDGETEDGKPALQMMDYSMFVPELMAKCQALERRLAAVEGRLATP